MATKFVECALGVKYRQTNADGSVSGGPMYYLRDGLARKGMPRLGRFLGAFYAVSIVIGCLGIGNMFQANQAYAQLLEVTGGQSSMLAGNGWLVGVAMASAVALIIVGAPGWPLLMVAQGVLLVFLFTCSHESCRGN